MMTLDVAARVLVVEDDAIVAMDIRHALESMGYVVPDVLADGDAVVESARALQPDIVLMDIRLPGRLDGIEAGAAVSSELNLPVVFLSAHADTLTLERAKAAGSWGYLVKPFDQGGLRAAIEVAMHRHRDQTIGREDEERHWCTIQAITVAVLTTDNEGVVELVNPAAEYLLARPRHRMVGQPVSEVVELVNDRGHVLPDPVATALRDSGPVFLTGRNSVRLSGGRLHPVRGCASIVRCRGDKVTGAVLVLEDALADPAH